MNTLKTLKTMFVAGSLAVLACPGWAAAAPAPDPRTTVLPIYTLPASAAADGKLAEWAGIPPSATPEQFHFARWGQGPKAITPSAGFAPALYCGMKKGSQDLYLLVVVRDDRRCTLDRDTWWAMDSLELYLDFGRENRDRQMPDWQSLDVSKNKLDTANIREMGQFGVIPKTLLSPSRILPAMHAGEWKVDYASALVEGGVAYEIRLDMKSVLTDLKLNQAPGCIGFDLGFADFDYAMPISTEGWQNRDGLYRLFGDDMDHAWPKGYGMLSLVPVAPPAKVANTELARTLLARFGEIPSADDVARGIAKLSPAELADLVYWAGMQGAVLTPDVVLQLMGVDSAQVQESTLAVLLWTDQERKAVETGVAAAYRKDPPADAHVLTLANMINEKFQVGQSEVLRRLIRHEDPTVAISAAGALAVVGTLEDLSWLQKQLPEIEGGLKDDGVKRAYKVYLNGAMEGLRTRVEPVTPPKTFSQRSVLATNTDLGRFIPWDGNTVYNASGLLRTWPKEGPKELWRLHTGEAKSAVVEVKGRAYTAGQSDGKQWALCLNAKTGDLLWRHEIRDKEWKHITSGPTVSPVVCDDVVYYVANNNAGYDPRGVLFCLNAKDGSEIWRSTEDYFGQADSTPLIVGDTLYLVAGHTGRLGSLVALNRKTGEVRWGFETAKAKGFCGSSASPVYQVIDGVAQIVFGMYGGVRELWGVSATKPEVYWTYPVPLHHALLASPVATGGRIFACGGQGATAFSALLQMHVKDGKVNARQAYRSEKNQLNMYNTVAIQDGAVFGFGNSAIQCTDIETGKVLWEKKGKEWGREQQLILADGLLFCLTAGNELVLLEAGKTSCQELGRVKVPIKLGIAQQPTLANGRLYVRGDSDVICYQVSPLLLDSTPEANGTPPAADKN